MNLSEQQSYGPLISKAALPGCDISNEMRVSCDFWSFLSSAGDLSWSAGNTPWHNTALLLDSHWGPAVLQSETGNGRSGGKDFTFCLMGLVSGARTRSPLNLAEVFLMCILIHFRKAALG